MLRSSPSASMLFLASAYDSSSDLMLWRVDPFVDCWDIKLGRSLISLLLDSITYYSKLLISAILVFIGSMAGVTDYEGIDSIFRLANRTVGSGSSVILSILVESEICWPWIRRRESRTLSRDFLCIPQDFIPRLSLVNSTTLRVPIAQVIKRKI
jgi:hypothetical protein